LSLSKILGVADEQGWTDETLLRVLLDWVEIQNQDTQERIVRYCRNRANEENDGDSEPTD